MIKQIASGNYEGIVRIPSSKSDTQRALLLAALTEGKSVLSRVGNSKDEEAMLQAIQDLGAKVTNKAPGIFEIEGIKTVSEEKTVNAGESGLGIRLLTSVCSLFDQKITLTGSGSLTKRPMDFFDEILPQLGVKVKSNAGFIPIEVQGPISGCEVQLDGSLSSQFLSGLLIALPFSKQDSVLHVTKLTSTPYVAMTLNSLKQFGIAIRNDHFKTFHIPGKQKALATNYAIEGDWSSASFWLVAAALGKKIVVQNLDPQSYQADKVILDILKSASCEIQQSTSGIAIDGKNRRAFEADLTNCPDLFPILAVFASLSPGKSKLIGTQRLIHKESNRAQAIFEEFSKLGCKIELTENCMSIEGVKQVHAAQVHSHNDHRIAMALAILALFSEQEITIGGAESVAKSYPGFWADLANLKK